MNINVNHKSIKVAEKLYLQELELGKEFLDLMLKAQSMK